MLGRNSLRCIPNGTPPVPVLWYKFLQEKKTNESNGTGTGTL
jgi:hypothetical protein